MPQTAASTDLIDSPYAGRRLIVTLLLLTLGSSSMYVVSVVLPAVQQDFNVSRADAALPYTLMMLGFGLGGIGMGRLADRFGVQAPLMLGSAGVTAGFIAAAFAPNLLLFALAHGILLGLLGSSATFAPLLADTALWWNKRRGIAVAVCASGNYLAGAVWPPLAQQGIELWGWRNTYIALGLFCGLGMALLSLLMRKRPPASTGSPTNPIQSNAPSSVPGRPFGLKVSHAQTLLCVAGVACCVAMAMPQVHIVAYCADLGYGAARGAQMLSVMLAFGIASRLISGFICDRIGGLRTLLLGSILQGLSLLLFLPFDSMQSLFLISATFGLFQGGIVPSYAIIIREYFPPAEVGRRVGAVIFATLVGMALGGWMSGKVFDVTGSYHAAFLNGIAWNLLNLSIASWLLWRVSR
jgi:MFS family permease